jgi:hypothetical protein
MNPGSPSRGNWYFSSFPSASSKPQWLKAFQRRQNGKIQLLWVFPPRSWCLVPTRNKHQLEPTFFSISNIMNHQTHLAEQLHPNISHQRQLRKHIPTRRHSYYHLQQLDFNNSRERSYFILQGKGSVKIAIITTYQVCSATLSSLGPTTYAMQQQRLLSSKLR